MASKKRSTETLEARIAKLTNELHRLQGGHAITVEIALPNMDGTTRIHTVTFTPPPKRKLT
jgi:hypothetical protein